MGEAQNPGAFVFCQDFLSEAELRQMATLAHEVADQKRNIATTERYASLQWYEVPLDPKQEVCAKLIDYLGVETPELLSLYYLEPGAALHPHRDLTGANLNNRIRFHIPIITNPGIDFRVSGQQIRMKPRDLWCLDTSYVHSVRNDGSESRVHIVMECTLTDQLRHRLPHGAAAQLHNIWFVMVLVAKFLSALLKNAVTNPRYFRSQIGMVLRFVGWRFLRIGKPR